jgi:hypothetical protein
MEAIARRMVAMIGKSLSWNNRETESGEGVRVCLTSG